jgi:hypothetical protein
MSGPDDHGVPTDDRGSMKSYIASDRIDDLVVVELEIDHSVLAKRLNRSTDPGIESDQTVAGRHVEDSLLTTIGPIRQTAAR